MQLACAAHILSLWQGSGQRERQEGDHARLTIAAELSACEFQHAGAVSSNNTRGLAEIEDLAYLTSMLVLHP